MELPNAATGKPAKHASADFYYAIPATVMHRTYPVYHPDHEPEGCFASRREKEPELAFDARMLASEADWIAAGERVFHWPTGLQESTDESRLRFRDQPQQVPLPTTADGILPSFVPFSHDGSVATLEDWFDPRRVEDDYVPTGWNPGGKPRAVPDHEFGLDLDVGDRRALIAFLRSL